MSIISMKTKKATETLKMASLDLVNQFISIPQRDCITSVYLKHFFIFVSAFVYIWDFGIDFQETQILNLFLCLINVDEQPVD